MNNKKYIHNFQGVGKSSLANTLIGYDNLASLTDKKVRKKLPFKIGHGLRSMKQKPSNNVSTEMRFILCRCC